MSQRSIEDLSFKLRLVSSSTTAESFIARWAGDVFNKNSTKAEKAQ